MNSDDLARELERTSRALWDMQTKYNASVTIQVEMRKEVENSKQVVTALVQRIDQLEAGCARFGLDVRDENQKPIEPRMKPLGKAYECSRMRHSRHEDEGMIFTPKKIEPVPFHSAEAETQRMVPCMDDDPNIVDASFEEYHPGDFPHVDKWQVFGWVFSGEQPTRALCPDCKGHGSIVWRTCSRCGGVGDINYRPDHPKPIQLGYLTHDKMPWNRGPILVECSCGCVVTEARGRCQRCAG